MTEEQIRIALRPYSEDSMSDILTREMLFQEGTILEALDDLLRITAITKGPALPADAALKSRLTALQEAVYGEIIEHYTFPDETTSEAYSLFAMALYLQRNRLTLARLASQNGNLPKRVVEDTRVFFKKYFAQQ